jgi:hypothetical protein
MIKTKQDAVDWCNAKIGNNWEVTIDAGESVSETFFKVNQGGSRVLENGISPVSFDKLVEYVYKYRKQFSKRGVA